MGCRDGAHRARHRRPDRAGAGRLGRRPRAAPRRRPLLPPRGRLRHVGRRGDATVARTWTAPATPSSSRTTSAPASSTTPARSPSSGKYRGLFREDMFDEGQKLDNPYSRTKFESEKLVRDETAGAVARVPAGDRGRSLRDRRDGQDRRALLLLQGHPEAARRHPAVDAGRGSRGRQDQRRPGRLRRERDGPHRASPGLDGQAFHLTDPNPKSAGQVINSFARAAHAPEATMRIDRQMMNVVPKQARKMIAQLPPVRRITDQVLGDFGIPRDVLTYIDYPTDFDSRHAQKALEGTGISVPALEAYAGPALGLLGAQPRPGPVQGPQPARRDRGQGRRHHRRLERHRARGGAEGRRGGRHRGARRALGGQARRRSKCEIEELGRHGHRASGRPVGPRGLRPARRGRPCEHGRVDVLVNNAGRSIRRSIANSYDRFHDFQRTMQLNYFGALKLIIGFLPSMRKRKSGHIINISSIGAQTNTPRFSAYVASKSALDAFSRSHRIGDRRRQRARHDRLHAAGAHADDRADRDVRRVPDGLARRGGRPDRAGHDPEAEEGRDAARAPSARCCTRWRRSRST